MREDSAVKSKQNRKSRKGLDPKERSWANLYLRHVAELAGIPYDGVRESMQILARYHGLEAPEPTGRAKRSGPAIELASLIGAKTGIVMSDADERRIANKMAIRTPPGGW